MLIWPIFPIWADPHSPLLLTAALKVTESVAYTAALAERGPGRVPAFRLWVNPFTAISEARGGICFHSQELMFQFSSKHWGCWHRKSFFLPSLLFPLPSLLSSSLLSLHSLPRSLFLFLLITISCIYGITGLFPPPPLLPGLPLPPLQFWTQDIFISPFSLGNSLI